MATALWLASRYVAAFMRASNAIYDVPEGRPVWKTLPIRVGVTVVVMVLLAVSAVAVVATGGLAERLGRLLGIGRTPVKVWDLAKWPVLLLIVGFLFALLYWASPNARQPFRWITPGGILAVVVWVVASAAFALYVANFNSYNKTYGSLASVIIFLVWLWLSNTAILLGAELNAELERGRAIAAGHPPDQEPWSCATPESSGNTTTCSPATPWLHGLRSARSVAWCSASTWADPDRVGLLTLEASSIQTDPDRSCRIVWMIIGDDQARQAARSASSSAAGAAGYSRPAIASNARRIMSSTARPSSTSA